MPEKIPDAPDIMTLPEVASIFRVDPKTVSRWIKGGKIPSVQTPGGHHRIYRDDVMRFFNGNQPH
jgi:excisionase family DNA binding protein